MYYLISIFLVRPPNLADPQKDMLPFLQAAKEKGVDTKGEGMLFYIDSKQEYAFKDELDKIKSENPKIHIMFLKDRKVLEENIIAYVDKHKNNSLYFISGNPSMVKEIRSKLKSKGIKKKNIINDSFRGYR